MKALLLDLEATLRSGVRFHIRDSQPAIKAFQQRVESGAPIFGEFGRVPKRGLLDFEKVDLSRVGVQYTDFEFVCNDVGYITKIYANVVPTGALKELTETALQQPTRFSMRYSANNVKRPALTLHHIVTWSVLPNE